MKLVQGTGLNDAGYAVTRHVNRRVVWRCPFYQTWASMLQRCYSSKFHARQPTYRGCTVAPEWLRFSVFRAWMLTQDWVGNELDKDLLGAGAGQYGPNTCVFLSPMVNTFVNEQTRARGDWPLGGRLARGYASHPGHLP